MNYIPRLKKEYKEKIVSSLKKEFEYSNVMQVPKLEKIVISKGVGAAVNDKKLIDHALEEITNISGQKAIATLSKKDVASFKLRKGMPIGVKVTLRGERMYEFLDRLVTAALPRVRDFTGVKVRGFDGRGNYNLGVTEQIIFPEINIDKINKISGMDITFVTNANSDKEAMSLLSELGLPFKKPDDKPKKVEVKEVKKEPVVEDVVTEEPVVEETVTEESAVEETVTEEPVVEETVTEESAVEETVTEEPVVEDVVTEESAVEETVTEEPVVEDVVTEESAVEETVTEEPVVEDVVTEEPVVNEESSKEEEESDKDNISKKKK
jgi:large subunit ribosomal protein L5